MVSPDRVLAWRPAERWTPLSLMTRSATQDTVTQLIPRPAIRRVAREVPGAAR